MGLWTLFEAASMPILQVLLISVLGALAATPYFNLLPLDSRRSLNKIVFALFTPSLMFASLAKTVTLQDIVSWWFMPVNIGFTFLIGGILGWILVKILKPKPQLEGLIMATCSAGNLGNLLLIIVPAICGEEGSPFGDTNTCRTVGLSYVSFSMALGGLYIWTVTFQMVRSSATKFRALDQKASQEEEEEEEVSKAPNKDLDATQQTNLLLEGQPDNQEIHNVVSVLVVSSKTTPTQPHDSEVQGPAGTEVQEHGKAKESLWAKTSEFVHQIVEELMTPPTLAAILGFIFGATSFLKNLINGENAPLRVVQDSINLLGDGTIPCITLILGANLTQGLRSSTIKPAIIFGVVCIRYILAPAIGICIIQAASTLGFLPSDPLYTYVLLIQYNLPPAMNIGTMTQLFDVAQEECSVLFLWTYLVSTVALTAWSTVYLWFLSLPS